MQDHTQIIAISSLEKGLKDSRAEIFGYGQFLDLGPKGAMTLSNPNAIYRIKRADGTFVAFGRPRPKFGKTWNRAGDLRSHITQFVRNGTFPMMYESANVVEIVMGPDGIMPSKVNEYPARRFYERSKSCAARLKDNHV